jgi:O-antigen/teichoic acid export membrane protein
MPLDPLRSILRNWSLLGSTQVVASLIAMVYMVVVSRDLGDVEFGRLFLALTLTALVGVIGDFGLSQVLARVIARDRAMVRPYLRRAALVVGAVSAVLYAVLFGAAQALGFTPEVRSLVLIVGVLVVAESFSQLLGGAFQGHERMLIPALTRIAANVLTLALVVPLLLLGYRATAVAIVLVLAAILKVVVQALTVRRLEGFRLPAPAPPAWRSLLHAGLPFLAAQGLGMFVVRIDVVMLGRLASDAAVGWYGAASRLIEAFNLMPIVLTTATFPVLSRLWVSAPAQFNATVRRTLDLVLVLSIPVAVTLLTSAQDIVAFLFTLTSYAPAVPILRLQAIGLPLVFVDYLLVCALMAVGRERMWIAIVAVACVLDPALDWILIRAADAAYANGGIGAAVATLLTELFLFGATFRALPAGTLDRSAVRIAVRTVAVGAIQAAAVLLARAVGVPWPLAAVIGGLLYLAAVTRLRLVPPDVMAWLADLAVRRPALSQDGGPR